MSLIRTFIAIQIPENIRQAIVREISPLKKLGGRGIRWVDSQNIHLTLKFLGEISPANVELLTQTLQAEAGLHQPFEVQVGQMGAFPTAKRPRVIWIGLEAPPALSRLQHGIESATAKLGYATDEKPFSPHLTIGRIRDQISPTDLQTIRTTLGNNVVGALGTFQVRQIDLMRSDLRPNGPIYSLLATAPLG